MASLPHHVPALEKVRRKSPDLYRGLLSCDYAYHVGFRNGSGRPGPVPANLTARVPLLADQPNHLQDHILAGNSLNHGGRGQNVLFSDGHISWHTTRQVSPVDLDMYLNEDLRPAPGISADDAALVPSLFPFMGR